MVRYIPGFITTVLVLISISLYSQSRSNFYVQLRNGQKIESYDIILKRPLFKPDFVQVNGQVRYDLIQVDKINYRQGYYAVRTIGISTKPTLLNVDIEGPISLFYQYKTNSSYDPYTGMYNYSGRRVYYLEKRKFEVEKFKLYILERMVEDHLPSLELVQKARKLSVYTYAGYLVGGGLMLYGFLNSDVDPATGRIKINPITFVGMGISIIPLITGSKKEDLMMRSILVYNNRGRN